MNIFEQLRRDESIRLKPYRDTVGKLTIGIGRNLDDAGISREEAEYLLANDVAKAKSQLIAALPWVSQLDDARQGVLINMAFNLGVPGLLKFRNTLSLIRDGKYEQAGVAMLQSLWAEQVGDRAHRLAKQMETGQWV